MDYTLNVLLWAGPLDTVRPFFFLFLPVFRSLSLCCSAAGKTKENGRRRWSADDEDRHVQCQRTEAAHLPVRFSPQASLFLRRRHHLLPGLSISHFTPLPHDSFLCFLKELPSCFLFFVGLLGRGEKIGDEAQEAGFDGRRSHGRRLRVVLLLYAYFR